MNDKPWDALDELTRLRAEVKMLRNQIVALEASSRTELNRAVKAEADCVALRAENERLKSINQKQT